MLFCCIFAYTNFITMDKKNSTDLAFLTANHPHETHLMQEVDASTGEVLTTDLETPAVRVDFSSFDFDALDAASEGVSVVPTYWKPTKSGDKSRGYFQGFGQITKNTPDGSKQLPVAMWLTREGVLMNGGAAFVDMFDNISARAADTS